MNFTLFSKISFKVSNPLWLIEAYCFQSDFYSNYDLLSVKTIKDVNERITNVNKIGARIKIEVLDKCQTVLKTKKKIRLFKYSLDSFMCLNERKRKDYIREFSTDVVIDLLRIKGIGFSKITKILHTLYPEIIPMIDNPLQQFYRSQINHKWSVKEPDKIFIDYYNNFLEENTRKNLKTVYKQLKTNQVTGLTKLRVFDILCWSYLKSKKLKDDYNIKWSSIK